MRDLFDHARSLGISRRKSEAKPFGASESELANPAGRHFPSGGGGRKRSALDAGSEFCDTITRPE
jgi:hypothetical protein